MSDHFDTEDPRTDLTDLDAFPASAVSTVAIIDQAGLPGTTNTWNLEDEDHAAFTVTPPAQQVAAFSRKFEAVLAGLGYAQDESRAIAAKLLPDVLRYDWRQAAGFPNGRRLTDDTADWLLALLTRGRLASDTVGPHTDLLEAFPYLGPPHRHT